VVKSRKKKKKKRKAMRTPIPIKKHPDEIKFYKQYAPVFGSLLRGLYMDIRNGYLKTGLEVSTNFYQRAEHTQAFKLLDLEFPFVSHKTYHEKPFGYPCCVSLNDTVAHGVPNDTCFKDGDIISIDCGIALKGPMGKLNFDSGFTVQYNTQEQPEWIYSTLIALKNIILNQPKDTYQIANIVENIANIYNTPIVSRLAGHGIGHDLHEEPMVRNLKGTYVNTAFFEGLCFCVEPIFVLPKDGESNKIAPVYIDSDRWSIKTTNGQPASHFETMYCIENEKVVDLCKITEWFK
jgi:methionyl aminopeptidase